MSSNLISDFPAHVSLTCYDKGVYLCNVHQTSSKRVSLVRRLIFLKLRGRTGVSAEIFSIFKIERWNIPKSEGPGVGRDFDLVAATELV